MAIFVSIVKLPFENEKLPSRGVLRKRCYENVQQIYKRTPMPKYDFLSFTKQLYMKKTMLMKKTVIFQKFHKSCSVTHLQQVVLMV